MAGVAVVVVTGVLLRDDDGGGVRQSRGSSLKTSDLIVTGTVNDGMRTRPRSM